MFEKRVKLVLRAEPFFATKNQAHFNREAEVEPRLGNRLVAQKYAK